MKSLHRSLYPGVKRGISNSDYWKHCSVLKDLEDNFAILYGEEERFKKIRCEVLIKPSEENFQVYCIKKRG